jgi:hypothetical protein
MSTGAKDKSCVLLISEGAPASEAGASTVAKMTPEGRFFLICAGTYRSGPSLNTFTPIHELRVPQFGNEKRRDA